MMRKESGSNSLTFFVACLRGSPRPGLSAGFEPSPRPSLPSGRDFGPVRTCGAFPPTAARRAPHRSRSHGRLRRPKSLPIRHSPAAAQCSGPWAGGIASVLTFWLHRFASLGLKSRIDARFLPRMAPRLQRFASLGLKSRITAAVGPFPSILCNDSQIYPLNSRIAAASSLRQRKRSMLAHA